MGTDVIEQLGPVPTGPIIVDLGTNGLANRMRTLAGFLVAGEALGLDVSFRWMPDAACPAEFTDLFADDPRRLTAVPSAAERGHPMPEQIRAAWTPHVEAAAFKARWARALGQLCPRPALAEEACALADTHSLSARPGIHVRWTDNRLVLRRRGIAGDLPRLRDLAAALAEVADGRPAWGCTDNPRALRTVARSAGVQLDTRSLDHRRWARVSMTTGDWRQGWLVRQRPTSVEDALIDLLTLAACSEVVGTWWSSFAGVAAALGGRRLHVVSRHAITVAEPS